MSRQKIAATRRNSQHKEHIPATGSGSTPDPTPKLRSIGRLTELRIQPDRRDGFVPREVPAMGELSELHRLLDGQRLILERENLPGSWAWKNPATLKKEDTSSNTEE